MKERDGAYLGTGIGYRARTPERGSEGARRSCTAIFRTSEFTTRTLFSEILTDNPDRGDFFARLDALVGMSTDDYNSKFAGLENYYMSYPTIQHTHEAIAGP